MTVWPSGSALMSCSVAILVEAPGTFSTMTGTPRSLEGGCWMARAERSFAPPAANGTMILMGLLRTGKVCAPANEAKASRTKARKLLFMCVSSGNQDDLADVCAAVKVLVDALRVSQRVHGIDDGRDRCAGRKLGPYVLPQAGGDLALLVRRAMPERRADDGGAAAQQDAHVERRPLV